MNSFSGVTSEKYHMFHHKFSCLKSSLSYTFYRLDLSSLYIFIAQLWLTSHLRSTVVLLDAGAPGNSREIFSKDADGEARTRNPSVINRVL